MSQPQPRALPQGQDSVLRAGSNGNELCVLPAPWGPPAHVGGCRARGCLSSTASTTVWMEHRHRQAGQTPTLC